MSAALPAPPGLTMKLACFSETRAPPRAKPFRPQDSIRLRGVSAFGRVAEHAARVGQLQRLRGDAALGEQRLHDGARLFAVAVGQPELRRGEPFVAVALASVFSAQWR